MPRFGLDRVFPMSATITGTSRRHRSQTSTVWERNNSPLYVAQLIGSSTQAEWLCNHQIHVGLVSLLLYILVSCTSHYRDQVTVFLRQARLLGVPIEYAQAHPSAPTADRTRSGVYPGSQSQRDAYKVVRSAYACHRALPHPLLRVFPFFSFLAYFGLECPSAPNE